MSDMKSKKEVSEAMEKQISEFGDIAKQLNKRMQPMILRMQKTAESAAIKYGMLESDFDEFMSQYKPYFLKNGFITPKDFDDFFSWLCGCRWAESNEPFGAMEIKESDFTLYHEYKELKLNPSGWNDHQERERLEDRFNPQTPQPITEQKTELSKIWLTDPKITVDRFLKLGVDKGIWDEQNNIITAKGSLYGTGKSLLGNLFIALKGYTISANIDYKIAGECFCKTFNIPIKSETNEPYKAFSSGSTKQIDVLKKAFNIK